MDISSGERGPDVVGAFPNLKVVGLSHAVSPAMPRWPGDPRTEYKPWSDISRDGYFLRRFSMGEHSGTHLTAPASYFPNSRTVDQFDAQDLVKPAVVIDIREQCTTNPDYAATVQDLLDWEAIHGEVAVGSLVLLQTGWAERWTDPEAYLGADAAGGLHFPGFGFDAANFLLNERTGAGLGTDTAGVEAGSDETLAVSRLALARSLIVLENLANLDRLPATGATLVIGVLRLVGGSGSPAAVIGFVPAEMT